MPAYVIAIDQGTTSSRAIVFNDQFETVGVRPAGIYAAVLSAVRLGRT
jgi:glycerol kinase